MAHEKLILGRYRVMSEAGSGGFAAVKVAWDTTIQRKVAIKVIELSELDALRMQGAGAVGYSEYEQATGNSISLLGAADEADDLDAEAADSFLFEHSLANIPGLDEARTAAMLSDANIVTVYDFQIQGTTAYLIMEYVEGITLTQLLRQVGDNLSLNVVTAVFSSVSHALEVAHRNQVLHLDIKPDNVLVNKQGQVKVTDFGLATLADASGYGLAGGGTIGYMPLEQMRQENLDARCDEWALASLTYEMLTGQNPFLAHTLEQAEEAIEDAELVLPSLCWDDVDPNVDDVMFVALDPDVDDRFGSVVEFAEELEPLLGDAKAGHRELAAIMSGMGELSLPGDGEPAVMQHRKPSVPLVDRLTSRVVLVLSRVIAMLAAGLVSVVALANVPMLAESASGTWENPVLWGIALLVALGAAIRPHIGALASFVLLAGALFLNGAYIVAVVLLVATGAWWWNAARRGAAEADVVLSLPLLGAFGLAPITPMLAGGLLPLAQTAIATAFSSFLAIVMASLGSDCLTGWQVLAYWDFSQTNVQASALALILQPSTWIIVASWMASAMLFSAFCYRGTRAFDIAGAVVAAVILVAGACIAGGLSADVAAGSPLWRQAFAYVFPSSLASALAIAAAIVGIPDRARWE